MKKQVLLNGVGRIGKAIVRLLQDHPTLQLVAINEINPHISSIAYSINYDSTYGTINDLYKVENKYIYNSQNKIKIQHHSRIEDIDLEGIGIIIDASGSKQDIDKMKDLDIKSIYLTHPSKDADINIVLGVNEDQFNPTRHKIISTSSCNATALLPLLKMVDTHWGIDSGSIVTVHPLLSHQKVLDNGCVGSADRGVDCNLEFGRSSTQNIIPSQTTTIEACSYVEPKFDSSLIASSSLRVPTPTVGAINVTLNLRDAATAQEFRQVCTDQASRQAHDIILNNTAPLVSSDFQAQRFTTIIDHRFTTITHGKLLNTTLWYDNEWGYASKVVDIVALLSKT